MKNKLMSLPKEKLVEMLEVFYLNLIKDPKYNLYSKSFFIEYIKNILEVYKRYKNMKMHLLLFKFDPEKIDLVKGSLRKSDLVAKYENVFAVVVFKTGEIGAYKVKNRLEKNLNEQGFLIEVQINHTLNDIIKEMNSIVKVYDLIKGEA